VTEAIFIKGLDVSSRITLRKGQDVTIPHDFGAQFVVAEWTFTCSLKKCIAFMQVPPRNEPVLFSIPVVSIADTGLGRVGVSVTITSAMSEAMKSDSLPYCLDIRGEKTGQPDYVSSPLFITITDTVTNT
jgi:hypothetical protein